MRLHAYQGRFPMPQTVGDMLAGWKSTFYRYYRQDYEVWSPIKLPKRLQRHRLAPKGKRLLYCTPPTPSQRFVIKKVTSIAEVDNASHPLPSGEGRVRDSQKTSINERPSPAAPAAASPEGRGDDVPLVKHTPTPAEILIHDDDVPPEILARFQAQLIHVLEQIDPDELQAKLSPEHWQLASELLSAKQERAG
jgi:hypothetical protein